MKKKLSITFGIAVVILAMAANGFGIEVINAGIDEEFGVFALLSEQGDSDSTASGSDDAGMSQPGVPGGAAGPAIGPGGDAGMTPGMGKGMRGAGSRAAGLMNYLDMTPDQVAKLKELRARYFMETRDLRYEIAMRRLEMMKLFTDPRTSQADLAAKQKELGALYLKKIDRAVEMMVQGRSILTPEQLAKLEMTPMWQRMMGGGMGAGRMGMMGRGMRPGMMRGGMMGPGMGGGMMNCP